jgi:two-component system, NtrC family, sensor kinase
MTNTSGSLLIVEADLQLVDELSAEAIRQAYRVRVVASAGEAAELVQREVFDAVLLDLDPGAETAFDLVSTLRRAASDTEVVVMSDRAAVGTAIQWFDPETFTFARKSNIPALIAAAGKAIARRRIAVQNRRLVWELQTINDVAAGLAGSLEIQDVMARALENLARAMDAIGGAIRLRDDGSHAFDTSVTVGPDWLRGVWTGDASLGQRPSDRVIEARTAVIVEDFAEVAGLERVAEAGMRSAISVPILAGNELVGTLSLGSARARRFEPEDQRLLTTIAGQIGVAVLNAQLHQAIVRAKREWEQTFDAIGDPIAVFNRRGELLRGNRALAKHLSLPVQAMRRLTCAEIGFCGGAPCPRCSVGAALRQEETRREVTLADGQIFSVTTFPIGVPGEGPSVAQVAKNVTEEIRSARRLQQMSDDLAATNRQLLEAMDQLKAAQAQLVQAEKLSATGRLVAGVAHELNNPLTSVIGYAQLVEEELREGQNERPPAEIAADLRRIAEEAERAARIVRNLLAFARRQSVARAPQDVVDVCRRVLSLREYQLKVNRIELDVELPADLPRVFADGGHLQQMLLNLILNAERAMRGQALKHLSVAVRHDEEAGAIEIAISDSGHGIDAENLSRVFDPFFTTREVGEGSGLGLSICYGIVRDHGGQISVESTPGVGATFRVLLPARLEDPDVAETTVLVAQADRSERDFAVAALSGWGYQTVAADTVEHALEAYARADVDVALLDRGLVTADPEAWRDVRNRSGRQAAVILVSMASDDRLVEPFNGEEISAVLVPPLELQRLHTAVQAGSKECV